MTPKGQSPGPSGVLVVDKPGGMTSHDVVSRVRRWVGTRKVGHAGTLDPMATGVLVLGVGRATRLLSYIVGTDKEYRATIRIGVATTTDDADGEVTRAPGASGIDEDQIRAGMQGLTGHLMQVPAAVSAIKVDGVRSYDRVRAGAEVDLKSRPVHVSSFTLDAPIRQVRDDDGGGTPVIDLDVTVSCSAGTYVRALARDLGANLGSAGHLTALQRTRVGPFSAIEALALPSRADLSDSWKEPELTSTSAAAARILPVREVTDAEARALAYGQWISATGQPGVTAARHGGTNGVVALIEDTGEQAKPKVVLQPASQGV